jgi:hypothetical protein
MSFQVRSKFDFCFLVNFNFNAFPKVSLVSFQVRTKFYFCFKVNFNFEDNWDADNSPLFTTTVEDRQTDRQADRQTGRQADRQTGKQADRQTDRQTDRN